MRGKERKLSKDVSEDFVQRMEKKKRKAAAGETFATASPPLRRPKHRAFQQHFLAVFNIACAECVEKAESKRNKKFVFVQHTKQATRLCRNIKARLRDVQASEIQSRGIRNDNICKVDQQME